MPLAGMNPGNFRVRRADLSETLCQLPFQLIACREIKQQMAAAAPDDPVREDGGIGALAHGGRAGGKFRRGNLGLAAAGRRSGVQHGYCHQGTGKRSTRARTAPVAHRRTPVCAWTAGPRRGARQRRRRSGARSGHGSGIRAATRSRKCSAISSMPSASGWH